MTLLDSLRKRVRFLEAAVAVAGATNARAVWGRAEDHARLSVRIRAREKCR